MKLGKMARVAWANIARGILLAFTLELPWPHSLHWLWSTVNWASFVMVIGSGGVLMVYGLLNAYWLCEWALTDDPPYECARDRLLREYEEAEAVLARVAAANRQADAFRAGLEHQVTDDRMAVGVNQDGEKVYVRVSTLAVSSLRYMGPPPVYVPARLPGKSNALVVHRDATWVFPAARDECLLRAAPQCRDAPCHCREQGYLP